MTIRNRLFFLPIFVLVFTLTTLPALADLPNFTELAKKAGPAVVNISTQKKVVIPQQKPGMPKFFDENGPRTPFDDFFKQFERYFKDGQRRPNPEPQRSLGSGFILSKDGYIATNNHVVDGADKIRVNILDDNGDYESYEAKIVGTDPLTDLALLKIETKRDLPTLELADFSKVEVGQWVLAIGNPFGLDHTVTSGIVSALGRNISNNPYDNFLQTDASINPGNSGGPLLNLKGEVIGINTAIIAHGQGIGFAIPSSTVKDIITKLKSDKKIRRGWIGVSITNVDPNMAQALGLNEAEGAFIAQVVPGEPAAKAGLLEGDIILAVNGEPVADSTELIRVVSALAPGTTAKFTVFRKDKNITINVKLGERGAEGQKQPSEKGQPAPDTDIKDLGLTITPLNVDAARSLGIKDIKGLLITNVAPESPASRAELHAGDVILEANLTPVNTVKEFQKILKTQGEKRGAMLLKIVRQQQIMFRTMTLEK
ncbi:DegQ family serine endoprotease [Halodesulfovibrio marinisediminis]|uniref:Probable periplasmic serine endoprotease DegP-like n=1 Tax=Halodesulfovibrio marinisediminis DSM 17456 TaxID=1121457 RepID=A0A1N6J8N4_9BACT|nr:DegQ family serine endoprotease [Halodesulfovibrio marinisediminis]SIO40603.1 serine protease Do [Halodesulfovibrio marinisediminis DSM 17456]